MKKINFLDLKKTNNFLLKSHHKKLNKTILSGVYTNAKEVKSFENMYSKFEGFKYCIAVNSGTSALHLALESLKLKKNSNIITTSHTFLATVSAIEYAGHKPIFIDIDPETLNIDINKLKKKNLKKIKAIIAVDMHGNQCEIEEIYKLCKKNNITLIQDSSQSHGTSINLKRPKNFIKCQSFYPTKNLGGIAEGGCIFINDKKFYERIYAMRDWGKINGVMIEKGFNFRMSEINAAFLKLKLGYLKHFNKKRVKLANLYKDQLKDLINNGYLKLQKSNKRNNVYHHFIIRVNKHIRDKLIEFLKDNKIRVMQHYKTPIHKEKYFKKIFFLRKISLDETEKLYSEMISLPCDPSHQDMEIKIVVSKIKKFFQIYAHKKL
jgi:dTDP-4-amino-4,6-dideoxygalactose transaminase